MDNMIDKRIIGNDGLAGTIADHQGSSSADHIVVQFDNGSRVMVPRSLLRKQSDDSYAVPISLDDVRSAEHGQTGAETVIPVVAEELVVGKRTVETSKVRIHKTVREHEEVVDEPLLRDEVEVERVPVNQFVERPVDARYEGDTLIVPVFEEVLVVEKRLVLREELHITRRRTEHHEPQQVTLRHEEVNIERLPIGDEERGERDGGNARVE